MKTHFLTYFIKRVCRLIVLVLSLAVLSAASQAADKPTHKPTNKKITKRLALPKYGAVLLFEPATGRLLEHHNADRLICPASLAKLMTTYVAFEAVKQRRFALTSKIKISDWARAQPPTRVGLKKSIDITLNTAHKKGTLDLSRKTRTWVCSNGSKPKK